MEKNPWHDLNSLMTSLKLGLGLLREELKLRIKPDPEIDEILNSLENKIETSVSQIAAVRKKFGDR